MNEDSNHLLRSLMLYECFDLFLLCLQSIFLGECVVIDNSLVLRVIWVCLDLLLKVLDHVLQALNLLFN